MDLLTNDPQFNTLSLPDLLKARDQFHPHLMHKVNVVGTAIGRYLIRQADPYPKATESVATATQTNKRKTKPPRTLENSEVRSYSWPCILVFVSRWLDHTEFGSAEIPASDFIPRTIYLDDGRSVPVCVVLAPLADEVPPPIDPKTLVFPSVPLSGGYAVLTDKIQGESYIASIACLVTDGRKIYALTNAHVAGEKGEKLYTMAGKKRIMIGVSAGIRLGRLPFEKVYETWPGKHIYVNADAALVEIDDRHKWTPAVYGIGPIGPLADLSIYNLTLRLIGCPVRANGGVSGALNGRIAALFYRYCSVGGIEYVADFLIGSRGAEPLRTRPGDSGTLWVAETDDVERDLMPIALQWGGTVLSSEAQSFPFALATNLSTVCRELNVEIVRTFNGTSFEYWESVGHYTVGSLACGLIKNNKLRNLMMVNQERVSFKPGDINEGVNKVTSPGFVPLANVPDKVWKKPKSTVAYGRKPDEGPNHYADIDYAPNGQKSLDQLTTSAAKLTTANWKAYYKAVGFNSPSQRGLLPFRVWQIYKEMVGFSAASNIDNFVCAAGVLAHYVGDACQPQHGSVFEDGDPFLHPDGSPSLKPLGHGQAFANGIHGAYEGDMLDQNYEELLSELPGKLGSDHGMALVTGGQNAGYAVLELMRRTRKRINPKDLVKTYADLKANHKSAQAPTILWKEFGAQTIEVIADGCKTLAMLWESAWMEGNGTLPDKPKAISQTILRKIYEPREFIPSKFLGQIDPFL